MTIIGVEADSLGGHRLMESRLSDSDLAEPRRGQGVCCQLACGPIDGPDKKAVKVAKVVRATLWVGVGASAGAVCGAPFLGAGAAIGAGVGAFIGLCVGVVTSSLKGKSKEE